MNSVFSREIKADLPEVDQKFRDSLLPWWDDMSVYYNQMQDDFTWRVLPAVVLNIYKHFGHNRSLSIAMASIFKTIYFSNCIHAVIKDDEEGQQHDDVLQFAILIGDYIFGTVLKSLVQSGTTNLVGVLSDMMCELNEGMVLKYKLAAEPKKVLEKTRAPLYGTAFLTAARLSGQTREDQESYYQMGHNLGMSIELIGTHEHLQDARHYIHKAEILMGRCNHYAGKPSTVMEKAIRELHLVICGFDKVAVV